MRLWRLRYGKESGVGCSPSRSQQEAEMRRASRRTRRPDENEKASRPRARRALKYGGKKKKKKKKKSAELISHKEGRSTSRNRTRRGHVSCPLKMLALRQRLRFWLLASVGGLSFASPRLSPSCYSSRSGRPLYPLARLQEREAFASLHQLPICRPVVRSRWTTSSNWLLSAASCCILRSLPHGLRPCPP